MLLGKEERICLPWGFLTGKAWGAVDGEPVLCVHGRNDNCATFDKLIPLLFSTGSKYFLAIDLPGHGRSDHYPPISEVTTMNYVIDIKRICLHYKWSKIDIISHSEGSLYCLYFASIFPEMVKSLVIIDLAHLDIVVDPKELPLLIRHNINDRISFETETQEIKKIYTKEEAISKISGQRMTELSKENLRPIVDRSVTFFGKGKVFIHTDKRINRLSNPFMTKEIHSNLLANVRSPILIILSDDGRYVLQEISTCDFTFQILKKTLGNKLITVNENGSHYVHLDNPQNIARHISTFFSNPSSKL